MARRLVRLFFLAASATTSSAVAPAPVWVAGACVGGVLGTPCVVAATKSWYGDGTLKLPSWTPPKGIFAPVWTALYACIGLPGYKAVGAAVLLKPYFAWLCFA